MHAAYFAYNSVLHDVTITHINLCANAFNALAPPSVQYWTCVFDFKFIKVHTAYNAYSYLLHNFPITHILEVGEVKEVFAYGMKKVQTCIIADKTNWIELSLWQDHILQVTPLKTYTLTKITTRHFNHHTQLTLTSQSSITETEDLNIPKDKLPQTKTHTKCHDHWTSFAATHNMPTLQHHTIWFHIHIQTQMHQMQISHALREYIRHYHGKILIQGETFILTHTVLDNYIQNNTFPHHNTEDIEEHFLDLKSVTITYNDERKILNIEKENVDPIDPEYFSYFKFMKVNCTFFCHVLSHVPNVLFRFYSLLFVI